MMLSNDHMIFSNSVQQIAINLCHHYAEWNYYRSGFKPKRSLEVVLFTSEEPTRFGISCLGRLGPEYDYLYTSR